MSAAALPIHNVSFLYDRLAIRDELNLCLSSWNKRTRCFTALDFKMPIRSPERDSGRFIFRRPDVMFHWSAAVQSTSSFRHGVTLQTGLDNTHRFHLQTQTSERTVYRGTFSREGPSTSTRLPSDSESSFMNRPQVRKQKEEILRTSDEFVPVCCYSVKEMRLITAVLKQSELHFYTL